MKIFFKIIVFVVISILGFHYQVFAEEEVWKTPELYIKAINPGYTIDEERNVGEMIEIGRRESDAPISLAGIAVSYTNSSGNESILLEFPENSFMTGETILLRLASSPKSELAALNYTKTLAFKAGISLRRGEEVVDKVCWDGKDGCLKDFKSTHPTVLLRNIETGEFEHVEEYEPSFVPENYYIEEGKGEVEGEINEEENKIGHCKGLEITEILSYYDVLKSEQFIEIYNNSAEQILMDGCAIRYKNRTYTLNGILKPENYYAYYPLDFNLTKNPTNMNILEIIDADGVTIDKMSYPNGQKKGTAYAMIGYDMNGEKIWRTTYAPTPNEPNNYQEYKSCEEGKVINEVTGNCVKVTQVTEKTCPEGQYLNTLTGRCKKYPVDDTVKECKEGYYLNPETGRCKKIRENSGAEYDLKPDTYEEKSVFVALYAILIVVGLVLVYIVYEFRHEIRKLFGKVFRRFR